MASLLKSKILECKWLSYRVIKSALYCVNPDSFFLFILVYNNDVCFFVLLSVRYCEKTQENEESKRRNQEIVDYIASQRVLNNKEIVKSIGYDSKNVEYYLFFGQKYIAAQN